LTELGIFEDGFCRLDLDDVLEEDYQCLDSFDDDSRLDTGVLVCV
jgi:hypothetical protein